MAYVCAGKNSCEYSREIATWLFGAELANRNENPYNRDKKVTNSQSKCVIRSYTFCISNNSN